MGVTSPAAILALDTSMTACSVALWRHGGVVQSQRRDMERGHAEALMPMVRDVLDGAGYAAADLDLVAVTVGPGAFTGLRIGLAAARGLALAAGLPCFGASTTETVAHAVTEQERSGATLVVALNSKRDDIYAQAFDADLEPLAEPRALLAQDVAELVTAGGRVVVAGTASDLVRPALAGAGLDVTVSGAPGVPDAAVLAALAAGRWRPGESSAPPSPLYLQPPAATAQDGGGRLRP
jgi:tRNA threonylcarbamoyladenosine biosynthesis protein TsaB